MASHNLHDEAAESAPNYPDIPNRAAPGISYFTPLQDPPSGTAADPQSDGSHPPKLFKPLTIRGVTFQNRIMWLSAGDMATEQNNGWPKNVLAPSAIPFGNLVKPKAMTKQNIEDFKSSFVAAIKRAIQAGFDVIEIHNAHGYLLHEFLSPVSNHRTDEYGGSWDNRVRLSLEILELARANMPKDMPLFMRISAQDWLDYEGSPFPECWTVADTARLAPMLAERGLDLIDCSSGGIDMAQKIKAGPSYQAPAAIEVKKAVKDRLLVSTVGTITNGPQAQGLLDDSLDAIFVGRMFQKNPGLVWTFAEELNVEIQAANQIRWGFKGRAGGRRDKKDAKM
ncbi:MAG: hypothetical protein Q9227_002293 [Pyrenula ochraceoflavens]